MAVKPPVRVLHVIPWVTSGGVERRRLELARGLDPALFEQRVVCLTARDSLRADFERAGVPVSSIGGTGRPVDLRSVWRVSRIARAFRPHIIHGAVFEGVTLASLAGRLARVPHVVVEEISDGENRSRRAQALFRAYAVAAHECIAVSEYAKRQLIGTGIPERRIRVIVNGISPPALPNEEQIAEYRKLWAIEPDDVVVCTIGRLHNEHKRVTDLIDAVALAHRQSPRVKLLIAGGGGEQPALEAHAARTGLAARIRFLGYQSDVGQVLSVADVFALASARESFGLVAVEAMSVGLPVVATAVGGLCEIVEPGRSGRLVPPRDPAALARALVELCSDADLRRRFGEAGRRRAASLFSAERYVYQVGQLYQSLALPSPRTAHA